MRPAEVLKGKRIFVTGASGFIGSALLKKLESLSCDVKGVRRPEGWEFLDEADLIFHLAAQTSGSRAELNPEEDYDANVRPVLNLIEKLRARKRPKPLSLVFAGTVTQCGMTELLPVNEEQPDRPITVYDKHKALAEAALLLSSREGLLDACSLRLSNVYGPALSPAAQDRGILNLMMKRALNGESLTLYGDGGYLRDYLFVEDAVSAFVEAAAGLPGIKNHYFVLGSGEGRTVREAFETILQTAQALTGNAPAMEEKPFPGNSSPIERRNFVADSSKFRQLTNWKPTVTFQAGILKSMEASLCAI